MKRIPHIILFIATFIALLSCENFRDDNGDLGGTWQLLQWRTRSSSGEIDSLVANNKTGDTTLANYRKLYYAFHRDVFQARDASSFVNMRYFFSFTTTPDSIILGNMVNSSGELLVDPSVPNYNYDIVSSFGIPSNGRFKYTLDNNNLVLSTSDDILTFRRY